MSKENLALWDSLFTTDPKATKGFTRGGGFKGTAIKPMWAVWRATKEFGPAGIGWGWTIEKTTVESGMVFCLVSVWYLKDGEKRIVGPQWGGTEIMAARKDGPGRPDDECFKKSATDGITKCLSYIGIGGDVHMGQFDDTKYVDEAAKTTAAAAAEDSAEANRLFVTGVSIRMGECSTLDELKALHNKNEDKLKKLKASDQVQFDRYMADLAKNKDRLVAPATSDGK
jgi:hypothetical protein